MHPFQLLFQVGVPIVLYIVIRSLWKVGSYGCPSAQFSHHNHIYIYSIHKLILNFGLPVAQKSLEVNYHLLFMIGEVATLDAWAEVISPSQPAALTAS